MTDQPDTFEYTTGPSVYMSGQCEWIIRRVGKPGIVASITGHEEHAKVAVDALNQNAEVTHQRDVALRHNANGLAAALHMALYDAHPAYGSTAGWRGGVGGQMVTPGCSMIDPPPDHAFLADALSGPLTDFRRIYGSDDGQARERILTEMRARQEKHKQARRARAMEQQGVHAGHCCEKHGCKYGDDDVCPVATGDVEQHHPCEWCSAEEEDRREARKLLGIDDPKEDHHP